MKHSSPSSNKSNQHYKIAKSTKYAVGEAFVGKEHHWTQADPRENNKHYLMYLPNVSASNQIQQRKTTTRTTSIAS